MVSVRIETTEEGDAVSYYIEEQEVSADGKVISRRELPGQVGPMLTLKALGIVVSGLIEVPPASPLVVATGGLLN
jgi:hypothetical protein